MQRPINFNQAGIIAAATAQGRSVAFLAALEFTLPAEGIYFEIVPGDPGGATCCGVTQKCYDDYRRSTLQLTRSVERITALEVASVYHADPWVKLRCDDFQQPLAVVLFDTAVNIGAGEAAILLQRALGIPADGQIGDATEGAEHAFVVAHGVIALAGAELVRRDAYYELIGAPGKKLAQFLASWLERDRELRAAISAKQAAIA